MATQISRSARYSAPVREMSFLDIDGNIAKSSRTRAQSPSSVRSFPDEGSRESHTSSIISQDVAPSMRLPLSTSRRTVGFEPWVGVKNTISRKDMTDEEKESYWLQDEDYTRIRRRNRTIIRCAETYWGEPLSPTNNDVYEECKDDIERRESGEYLCIRGLESGSKSESFRKKTYRRNSLQRVLIEQEFQCLQGFRDEETIAELYIEVTSPCKLRAEHRAVEDHIAVQEYSSVES